MCACEQVIDQGGFYDLDPKKLYLKEVADCCFLAACGPGLAMSPRVSRHFNMFYVPLVATSSMKTIFESILTGFLSDGFSEAHAAIASQLVDASVELYQTITKELRPTPSKLGRQMKCLSDRLTRRLTAGMVVAP